MGCFVGFGIMGVICQSATFQLWSRDRLPPNLWERIFLLGRSSVHFRYQGFLDHSLVRYLAHYWLWLFLIGSRERSLPSGPLFKSISIHRRWNLSLTYSMTGRGEYTTLVWGSLLMKPSRGVRAWGDLRWKSSAEFGRHLEIDFTFERSLVSRPSPQ